MNISVRDIFLQKLNEIQNKVPVRLKGLDSAADALQQNVSFQAALDNAVSASSSAGSLAAVDKYGNDRSADLARARAALAASTAYIPSDKTELMKLINSSISTAAAKYGMDENLIRAVVKQESGYNPYSISRSGAQGLMQLMPGTADGLGVTDPFDISQNIDGGVRYLKAQLDNFGGDISLALAAYNAGPNSVRNYNGIPPYTETQNYVARVLDYFRAYGAGEE